MKVILYSGKDCCLCDQAEALIQRLDISQLQVTKVDVRASTDLYHLYGARIPVLVRTDNKELDWPFDQQQLQEFLV